jgi:PAS domain-containing protein
MLAVGDMRPVRRLCRFRSGTSGSNPLSSSGESAANLTFEAIAVALSLLRGQRTTKSERLGQRGPPRQKARGGDRMIGRQPPTGNFVEFVGTDMDITERRRAEAEILESERRYREIEMQVAHAHRVATMGQLSASRPPATPPPCAA